jgi:hypothetical protein
MMVPTQLGIIPLYMLMTKLNWNDHLPAVIVPALVTGFGVFMMRQYASQAIADELIEAARVDGCSTFRVFYSVVLPALRPAAAVLGLLTFMTTPGTTSSGRTRCSTIRRIRPFSSPYEPCPTAITRICPRFSRELPSRRSRS